MCFVEVVCCEQETYSLEVHHHLVLISHFLFPLTSVSLFLMKHSNPSPEVSCFLHDLWSLTPLSLSHWVHIYGFVLSVLGTQAKHRISLCRLL